MNLGLKEKVAIVTGASRGIGRAIALGLAEEGCHLAICARTKDALAAAADECRARGVSVLAAPADVTKPEEARRFVDEAVSSLGRIDILVNNVGGSRQGDFLQGTDADWQAVLDLNLLSSVRMSRQVIPLMKSRGNGVILIISSIYGRESGGPASYNAAKAAEIGLAKALARELAPYGIRVNSVAPGSILFPGGTWERRMQENPEKIRRFIETELPLGRFGRPEEVANVVVFLSSDRASLVTGACINVDGCQSRSNI